MATYGERLLGKNEKILLTTRQHWLVLFRETFKEIIFAALIIVLAIVGANVSFIDQYARFGFFLLILPAIGLIYDYMIWWNREYIVTNHRVIQIAGVLSKSTIDSSLEKVNDVELRQSLFGRLFDYGDVEILTASSLAPNLFQRINDPIKFKTIMLDAKDQMGRDETGGDEAIRSGDLPALLASLEVLRKQGVLTEDEFQKKKAELLKKM